MKKLHALLAIMLLAKASFSQNEFIQTLEPFYDQQINIHSYFNSGSSRNWVAVDIPINERGFVCYVYKVSIREIGGSFIKSLIDFTKQMPDSRFRTGGEILEMALDAMNGKKINFYLLNNINDANNFINNKAFRYCRSFGTEGFGFNELAFKSNRMYFGFENPNPTLGLTIRLEVAAVFVRPKNPPPQDNKNEKIAAIISDTFPKKENTQKQTQVVAQPTTQVNTKPDETLPFIDSWQTTRGAQDQAGMKRIIKKFMLSDSSLLKSGSDVSWKINNCVIKNLTNEIGFTEYNDRYEQREALIRGYYNKCAPAYYFQATQQYNDAIQLGNEAWKYFEQENYDSCIALSHSAIEKYPLAYTYFNAGICYLIKGENDNAELEYQQGIKIIRKSEETLRSKRLYLRGSLNDLIEFRNKHPAINVDRYIEMLNYELNEL